MNKIKIIVLTPVKNEEWILERFLTVTSVYADCIIVIDQNSSDSSREICRRFPKVVLMVNHSDEYDEASRQILLIEKARELAPNEKRILLAFDADEILAADYLLKKSWQDMLAAPEGTVLYFNKFDLYKSPFDYIDYNTPWPLGFIDDGSQHTPRLVHSIRIPTPVNAPRLVMKDVVVLHYAMVDIKRQNAKMRMYSVIEKLNNTSSFYNRRIAYAAYKNWVGELGLKTIPIEWINGWKMVGVDLINFPSPPFYWQDIKVLELLRKHGEDKFYSEDIWDVDWNRLSYISGLSGEIRPPSFVVLVYYRIWLTANRFIRALVRPIILQRKFLRKA